MLNIGKLATGGETYYLDTVASGAEDYYTGAGEADGYWTGRAAAALGLTGRVEAESLRSVLGARHPDTGEPLTGRASPRKVPGFDCTFRAPKSVSLLYGLGDHQTAHQVRQAHDAAVVVALAYLEDSAAFSRRGHSGAERVQVTGFVAAAFRHRTSRAADPLLHTHVLVANIGCAIDDAKWRTLDGRSLYLHAKTAGFVYQAQLRYELSQRLGVAWTEVRNGWADVEGVPEDLIRAFSQRRTEIIEHMAARGESSARAAQIATLATRKAKRRGVTPESLASAWHAKAAARGWRPAQLARVVTRDAAPAPDAEDLHVIAAGLLGEHGLTAQASTFGRRDAIRSWCEALPSTVGAADAINLADQFLGDRDAGVVPLTTTDAGQRDPSRDQAIRLPSGALAPAESDEPRFSTSELLALEQEVVLTATRPGSHPLARATDGAIDHALRARPTLSEEQRTMVRRLTTSAARVDVVIGKAGTGKTFSLDAARAAWQDSGVAVLGCALAARAAAELHAGAGIPSMTIDSLLAALDHSKGSHDRLAPQSVLVVDEAGMVGTRKLARLFGHAEKAGAKVVLVGDPFQLPEIDAGGVLRALQHRLPVIELTDNRRQREIWERQALDELRTGDPVAAITAYEDHNRVVTGHSADAVRERLIGDWWAARNRGETGVMVAIRVSDVEDLNERARGRLSAAGVVGGASLTTPKGRVFQAGDEVVCLRNDRRNGLINGTRATVMSVDTAANTLTLHLSESGRKVRLPTAYVEEHLVHGYAITGHKAQGLTTERAWVLGSDAVYREWGYVAMSRARASTQLYVVNDHESEEIDHHGLADDEPPIDVFSRALRRTRQQSLGIEHRARALSNSGGRPLQRLKEERAAALESMDGLRQQIAMQSRPSGLGLLRRHGPSRRLHDDLRAWEVRVEQLDERLADAARVREIVAEPDALTSVDNSEIEMRRVARPTDDRSIGIG